MTEERSGGRFTFSAFLLMGCIWLTASTTATGGMTVHAVAGAAVFVSVGAIVGMFVGFYNLGRERGR
jgi:hypothetical protein